MSQSYTASRVNPGGNNGVVTVALDREDLDSVNRFDYFAAFQTLQGKGYELPHGGRIINNQKCDVVHI